MCAPVLHRRYLECLLEFLVEIVHCGESAFFRDLRRRKIRIPQKSAGKPDLVPGKIFRRGTGKRLLPGTVKGSFAHPVFMQKILQTRTRKIFRGDGLQFQTVFAAFLRLRLTMPGQDLRDQKKCQLIDPVRRARCLELKQFMPDHGNDLLRQRRKGKMLIRFLFRLKKFTQRIILRRFVSEKQFVVIRRAHRRHLRPRTEQ